MILVMEFMTDHPAGFDALAVRGRVGAIVAQSILALPRKGLPACSSSCGDPKGECNA